MYLELLLMKKHGTNKKNKTPGRTAIDPPINSFHSGPGGDTDTHTTKETPLKEENRVQFRQVHYVESKQQKKNKKNSRLASFGFDSGGRKDQIGYPRAFSSVAAPRWRWQRRPHHRFPARSSSFVALLPVYYGRKAEIGTK